MKKPQATAVVVATDPLFRDAAIEWLRSKGWNVYASEQDGLRALSILARHPIDAILVIGDVAQISAQSLRWEVERRWPQTSIACVPGTDRAGPYDVDFDGDADAIIEALTTGGGEPSSAVASETDLAVLRLTTLTPRERTVLERLGQGMRPSEIADDLGLSRHTVRAHLANLHRKLDVHRRVELIRLAAAAGLIPRAPESAVSGASSL